MPKKLRDRPLYLASQIYADRDAENNPRIIDERNGHILNPHNIDDKIYIYERQVKEWFLNRATRFSAGKKNDFVVVMIATSYIEGVQQYINGEDSRGHSKEVFRQGMRRIFNLPNVTDGQIDDFYIHVRCGLFHNGMSGDAVVLSRDFPEVITFFERGTIDINPILFLSSIIKDFDTVLHTLKDERSEMDRLNFNNMFTVI